MFLAVEGKISSIELSCSSTGLSRWLIFFSSDFWNLMRSLLLTEAAAGSKPSRELLAKMSSK